MNFLLNKLIEGEKVTAGDFLYLLENQDSLSDEVYEMSEKIRFANFSNGIYIRGLIEISNYCKNDCYYCGIRKSNSNVHRYRLSKEEILFAVENGRKSGINTFVLQGGEDACFSDELLCDIIGEIKSSVPGCAVTLSLGERSRESYENLRYAGADRYLLRHETINEEHYAILHPKCMEIKSRRNCLDILKQLGYQVGCGMMIGSFKQELYHIAEDLEFIWEFKPHMVGIGPFIPQPDTPFAMESTGSAEFTAYVSALTRIAVPFANIPATTALATVSTYWRNVALRTSANVVMPNLSPSYARDRYVLYEGKKTTGSEGYEGLAELATNVQKLGLELDYSRGDYKTGRDEKNV